MTTPLQEAINDLQFMRDRATDAFSDIVWGMAISILRDVYIEKERQFLDAAREDEAVAILEWYDKLSPAEKCTVHPPAGSGGSTGIYNLSYKQLYQSYLKHKNEKL